MHWLVENISPMQHHDYLYAQKALNEEEYQTIYAEKAEATKVIKTRLNILNIKTWDKVQIYKK